MTIAIDRDRLVREIEDLALISDAEPPAVTRIVFSQTDLKARAWLIARCEKAGLEVRQDAIGNIFAKWAGSEGAAPAVGTGSHTDAIPNAGKYDGVVGVLGGLEAIRSLQRSGFRPKHSIELLMFTSEEPTRFGIGCLGSRLLSGTMSSDAARKLLDKDCTSIEELRAKAGFTGALEAVKLPTDYYKAFVELHIEQGPVLEQKNIALGIVTDIAAPASLRITVDGSGGHAAIAGRRWRARGRSADARSQRRFVRGGGAGPRNRKRGAKQWSSGYGGHCGHLRSLSRCSEQHSQPRQSYGRHTRHGSCTARCGHARDQIRLSVHRSEPAGVDARRICKR